MIDILYDLLYNDGNGNEVMFMMEEIKQFQTRLNELTYGKREKWENDQFYLLLSMLPCVLSNEHTRMMEVCESDGIEGIKEHLHTLGITDKQSLHEHMRYHFNCGDQYDQFVTFWEGKPCFDIDSLQDEGKAVFTFCIEYAKKFSPFVKQFGFHAWDIGEGIHRLREAYTCGMITLEEAKHDIQIYVDLARKYFDNFRDYALSYVCGSMYFMMRESRSEEHVKTMRDMILQGCEQLLFTNNNNTWTQVAWLPASPYFSHLMEQENLGLKEGGKGCFVTDRVSMEGYQIGYFYREKGMEQFPDSGWRFFAGDEDQAYLEKAEHTHIFSLNTLANVFPDLIDRLDEPAGSAFALGKDGKYYKIALGESQDA